MIHVELRAETVLQGAKVFMILQQCLVCDGCAANSPKEQCPFPASSLCLVPYGFVTTFLALFVLLKIPATLAQSFWMSALGALFEKGGHSPSYSTAKEEYMHFQAGSLHEACQIGER